MSARGRPAGRWWLVLLILPVLAALVAGGMALAGPQTANLTPVPTQAAAVLPSDTPPPPTATLTAAAPPTATPPPPTATLPQVDYSLLEEELAGYAARTRDQIGVELGIAFIDLRTGHSASLNGEDKFYSLSTFKSVLAVYYLWLLERGELVEQPLDDDHLYLMLNESNNPSTSCIIQRVGGLEPFNDWLADALGMDRTQNFVMAWQSWQCSETLWLPPLDRRYLDGAAALGLPDDGSLLDCSGEWCNKSFTPNALADFYARFYNGDLVSPQSMERWYTWMVKKPESTFFDDHISVGLTVYSKNGYLWDTVNHYHEAGIVTTPHGDYVLVVFMQKHPQWPGAWTLADVGGMVYTRFAGGR